MKGKLAGATTFPDVLNGQLFDKADSLKQPNGKLWDIALIGYELAFFFISIFLHILKVM